MSKSVVELNPNEKINLELNQTLSISDLVSKIKDYITTIHVYKNSDYFLINIFKDGSFEGENLNLDNECKIILENGNDTAKIILDFNANVLETEETEKSEEQTTTTDSIEKFLDPKINPSELKHWSAESIKTINIPHEKQSIITGRFKEMGFSDFGSSGENYLSLVEECSATSTTGNISFRFFFMEGKSYLKNFHYQMFLILKKFIEKLILSHKHFRESHYVLDVFVFVNNMKEEHLGSAMIHKYVKNEENDLILPTKAVMKINQRFLSKKQKDKINVKLMQTLFHELLHCLGFGYWDLFGKNLTTKNLVSHGSTVKNVMTIPKTTNIYRNFIKDGDLLGVPLTEDGTHYNTFNIPVTKNGKLFGVLPGMKYELMSNNDTELNVFTKLSASVIEALGYQINYYLCDDYPFTPIPQKLEIEYAKPSKNHFANGYEKYVVILKNGKNTLTGIETFSMKENTEYIIKNRHSYSIYIVSALEENEKYLLGEKEGIMYKDNEVIITPNTKTPSLFYVISSITFAGIPIVKIAALDNVNYKNCFNHNSLKKLMDEFIEGKSPRLQ